MTQPKPLSELTIMDDYMFGAVMRDERLIKPLIEFILGVKIKSIRFIDRQKTFKDGYESRGIRLDLYVEDQDGAIYNVEIQTSDKRNLPRRMRYHQSAIDIEVLSPGANFKDLRKSYIIFICNYDPFGQKRYIYTFENRCLEDLSLRFGDDAVKVVVNTKGETGEISDALKEVIRYLDSGTVSGEYTQELEDAVNHVKGSEERRLEYMTMWIHDMEIREEARENQRMQDIRNLMENMGWTAQQAEKALGYEQQDMNT